jgi:hypothetical protein
MCSIEDAWGTPTFFGKTVESQADDRVRYMKTPDNLLFPGNNPGPLTKTLPNKNKYTRGIHSELSRQQRVPNMTHQLRGGNAADGAIGQVNTNIDTSEIGSYKAYTPDYMNIYNRDPQPSVTKLNKAENLDTSMCNPEYSNFDDAFMVSNTVDKFMNIGMNMSDDEAPVELQENVNYNWEQGVNPNLIYTRGRMSPTNTQSMSSRMNNGHSRNNMNNYRNMNNNSNRNNSVAEPMPTKQIKEMMSDNTEVIKLLNNVLSRLEIMEKELKKRDEFNVNDLIIYFTLGCVIIMVIQMVIGRKH